MPSKSRLSLLGARDAWALTGLSAGLSTALPSAAGLWPVAAGGLVAAAAGGAALALPRAMRRFDPVDEDAHEDFVLSSDTSLEQPGPLIGYTTDTHTPIRIPYDLFMRHLALVGASGVGKTTLGMWLIWQQIVSGGGLTFIDAKLDVDTRDMLGYLARMAGREDDVYILNIGDPEHSNTYNPILNGSAFEVASRLMNLQPSAENNAGADHYRQSAFQALTTIIGALKAAKLRYHFTDLTILLQSAPAMEAVLRQVPPGEERMALEVFLDKYRRADNKGGGTTLDVNKMKDTLGGMAGRLSTFSQGSFGKIFNTYAPEIDLTEIIKGNKILYIMLPTMGMDTAALNVAKMALSDVRTAVAAVQALPKARRPWPPYMIFADEMGSYVMEGIARLFEQARSGRIAMLPGFQSFGNLRAVSPEFADIILQNTWSKALFRFGSSDSGEVAAEMIGKIRKYVYSISQSESEGASAQFLRAAPQSSESASGGMGESWREEQDYRVSPAHLAGLGIGQCILTIGSRTYHLKVPRITTPIDDEEEGDERDPALVFHPLRRPTRVPDGERTLDLASRYASFLS